MIPEIIKLVARDLRNNSTKAEIILWNHLKGRKLGYRFNRQAPLYAFTESSGLKRYIIPDFYRKEKKLIIEIDGDIHKNKDVYILDEEKEKLVKNKGINILRITNENIYKDIDNVVIKITDMLN